MKKVLLDPGMLPFNKLKHILGKFSCNNSLSIITEEKRKDDWVKALSFCKVNFYSDLKIVNALEKDKFSLKIYDKVFKELINDHRTLLIAERVTRFKSWNSLFSSIQLIENQAYNCILLLNKIKPDFLLFQATPHSLSSWILAKTAELIGIQVYMIQTSPLPWRYWIVEGLDVQKPIKLTKNNKGDLCLLENFISMNSSSYKKAIPSYESKRIESRGGKFWSWKKELVDAIKNPHNLLTILNKRQLYNTYHELSHLKVKEGENKIVMFLHFQPERTSLPEGKNYSQQWIIIRALSLAMPEGWVLLVKEHPSTFTGRYDVRYRNPKIYHDISSLPNVSLVPIERDTFELIDNAKAIATITGTVGVQSLIRGVPVLVFGFASYRDAFGVLNINDIDDIESAINRIGLLDKNMVKKDIFTYLNKIISDSYSELDNRLENGNVDIYSTEVRVNGHIELLKHYLN